MDPLADSLAGWRRRLTPLPDDRCPGVRLWLIDLEASPPDATLAALSDEERARAARFVFERDRRRYLASHVGLRLVLADAIGRPPDELAFTHGPHGKPALADAGLALNFNLSHSGDWALVGLATDPALGELGVDLETVHPIGDLWLVARAQFDATEVAELRQLDEDDVARHFLIAWTRKEACLKALGSGFSIPSDTFYAGVRDRPLDTRIPTPQGEAAVHVRGVILGIDAMAAVAWRC